MSSELKPEKELDTTKKEDQDTFDTLFFIALEDLDCSTILYHREHYPQAVFYLQQAVEKAVKSLGLTFGIIKDKDLQGNVGHKPLEVYRKPVNKFSEDIMELNKKLEIYPEFKGIMETSGVNFDDLVSSLKKGKHEFNEYIRTVAEYNLTSEELEEYLTKIEDLNKQIREINRKINEEGISDEKFAEIKGEIKNTFESTVNSLKFSDEQKENIQKELESLFDSSFPFKEILEYVLYFVINTMGVGANLFYLSVITSLHSSKARYPEENFNPLTFYTPELPLIEKLPEIQNITRKTLEEMDMIYNLMANPPEFLQNLSENSQLSSKIEGGETKNEQ